MEILTLWPFSQGELAGAGQETFVDSVFNDSPPSKDVPAVSRAELQAMLVRGGYPPAVERQSQERRRAWFGSYVATVLDREVRDLAHIEGLTALPRLLALLAARAASLLNASEVSRGAGIPNTTLKRYFALLEATFLVQLIPAWSANLGKRLVKSPKIVLNDTGLIAYLLGVDEGRLAADPALWGRMVENFVAMELRKQIEWSRRRPRLFHFRPQAGHEVDLVLEDPAGDLAGIEVKASAAVTGRDFQGLRTLAELAGARFRRGIVLYTGAEALSFATNLHALPLGALWG
jgi:predicted AAA+ superfamily ATPase